MTKYNHATRSARLAAWLASTALALHPMAGMASDVLPAGGQVVSGSVAIGANGSAMTVTQGSDKAIVNWNGFSIGSGNSVNFVQPHASSAILNRVTGSTTSTIAGSLTGNGQVYLINPNGIAITPSGSVKVGGGFVASSLDMSNEDFLKGQYNFNGNGASAGVSNEGVITVGRGGYAALIGGTVRNDGLIAVPIGKVGLGSGEQATLDLSGDGFLQVAVPTKNGAEGDGALIENRGKISADGGTVVMQAATARNAARKAVNISGSIEANSISGGDGEIVIGGGEGGDLAVSGKIKATPDAGKGGKVTLTGKSIALKGATVDVSGAKGGGEVKIGGDKQGKGKTQRAETVSIDAASAIRADATQSGNGGNVVVWSDEFTSFTGLITALGAGSGKGGDVEVSGKAVLDYAGLTNLSGPGGFGTLLLDPYNLTISNAADSGMSGFSANADDSVLNVNTLTTALGSANVTVTTGIAGSDGAQAGTITVANTVQWSSGTQLILSAYGSVNVNSDIRADNGGSVLLRADNSGTGTGTVTFASGMKAYATGGVSIYYNPTSYTSPTDYSANAGAGTTLTAYMLVNTLQNLQDINDNLSGKYALGRDIDASATASWNTGAGFVPISDGSTPFTGSFDGQNHTITGLTIKRPSGSNIGLFGFNGNVVKNVGLINADITGQYTVGALAGYNGGTISGSYATGTVAGDGASSNGIGGLVGSNNGTISQSYASVAVSGGAFVGGLVGDNQTTIDQTYADGFVTGTESIGGLVGVNEGTLANSYATGDVSGAASVGGLVGANPGAIVNAYAVGSVNGTLAASTAALVGLNTGYTEKSFWNTTTSGQTTGAGGSRGYLVGLTTAEFQDTAAFKARLKGSNWDFTSTWAPPSSGYYPQLYALTPVVYVSSATYSSTYGDFTATARPVTRNGGPSAYVFGPAGDSLSLSGATITVDPLTKVGTLTVAMNGSSQAATSTGGVNYRVLYAGSATATVTKAPLEVTAAGTQVYGDASPTYSATITGWKNGQGDSNLNGLTYSTTVTATSNAGGSYKATASGGTLNGAAEGNYEISYVEGAVSVAARPITITANAQSMVYGDTAPTLTYTVGGSGLVW
ncbi:beta strand repeat-containing protein [Rhizobium oryzicola]|uniref:Filamentous hemagglutinin N-terminal domain-containing protein n=1 Tax=Rhizobium oryzicola TaxID=1232668 RepID=A0ABT8SYC1_9HYPH|nr:filamentous hemagglutinin N-terminal domain-containing protein [Rhizobium oryzicola]MDO1583464.1 filamentous hemagglutinin N-terminal domain-containing protein [Rhizobium oryzicola]